MSEERTAGPYIVWTNYGCDGWRPESYPDLISALLAERYNSEFVITKKVTMRPDDQGRVIVE